MVEGSRPEGARPQGREGARPQGREGARPQGREGSHPEQRRPGEPQLQPGQPDPTKMINQPALQTSSGRVWLVMGGFFAAAALVPFVLLIMSGGPSALIALAVATTVVVLYVAMLVVRLAIPHGPTRLRWLAACMLTMAAVALVGVWVCAMLEAR